MKKNVFQFNQDVLDNKGYKYTTNASYSSIVANDRLTKATLNRIPKNIKSILDIGCGDGIYTNQIRIGNKNKYICGLDLASNAIKLAKENYPEIDFFVADIMQEGSLPKNKFDLAIMRGVLHHVSDQQIALRNALLIADRLLILEPNGNNPVLKIIEKLSPYHRQHEEQSFSFRTWRTWLKKVGWRIELSEYVGFVPFFFPEKLAKIIHYFQPVLEKTPILNRYLSAVIVILCKNTKQ